MDGTSERPWPTRVWRIGDALGILNRGQVYDEPEQDIKTGDWKYRMEGETPGGKRCAHRLLLQVSETTLS